MNTSGTRIGSYPIGAACPWRVIEPAALSPLARTLEAARTRPWLREALAREGAGQTLQPPPPAASEVITWGGHTGDAPGFT